MPNPIVGDHFSKSKSNHLYAENAVISNFPKAKVNSTNGKSSKSLSRKWYSLIFFNGNFPRNFMLEIAIYAGSALSALFTTSPFDIFRNVLFSKYRIVAFSVPVFRPLSIDTDPFLHLIKSENPHF